MKKCLRTFALLTGVLGGSFALRAETVATMHAPFEFVAAGKTLPAGDYRMELLSSGALLISGLDAPNRVLALINVGAGGPTPAAAFGMSGSEHVLTSVTTSTGTWYLMNPSQGHIAVALRSKK